MIRVAVLGAEGRMGREVCAAVQAEPDLELTEEVDVGLSSLDALVENQVQVAVDFTNAEAASENIPWCIKNGIHVVVGSSGIPPEVVQGIAELCPKCEGNVLIAPNFAIGAVLAMKFAEIAAAWMPDAEVIELHHSGKMDSPSGTALQTVESILRGRTQAPVERPGTLKENLPGARGAEREGVHVHSVRLPGLVAHQEVLFGGPGQTLTIRHDSLDRKSFMPGVILGIREIANHPGLTVGLEHYLGL
ncbi:MAG TPA: 4-hydroxy-tetrahydrodipicolinate reductase [Actinomycetota bacterium]|nr:4-hydroxy-tetrahydrodipicolinate reductase [Actinomycetota bacterium]